LPTLVEPELKAAAAGQGHLLTRQRVHPGQPADGALVQLYGFAAALARSQQLLDLRHQAHQVLVQLGELRLAEIFRFIRPHPGGETTAGRFGANVKDDDHLRVRLGHLGRREAEMGRDLADHRRGLSGTIRTSMLRAARGWLRMSPFASSSFTIRWTVGGVTSKKRCISASAGGRRSIFE
jgi:hypothetical protein